MLKKIPSKLWQDWKWQISCAAKSSADLAKLTKLSQQKIKEIDEVIGAKYQKGSDSMRLTPYLISLIDFSDANDPIALQHIPSKKELILDDISYDEGWEQPKDFLDGKNRLVQQKYPDIILLRISNTCFSYCRFCFEKERTLNNAVHTLVNKKLIQDACQKIKADKNVYQVLLSGGDPLVLPDSMLKDWLEELIKIPQLKTIRINTRTLLHNPFRITKELCEMLSLIQTKSWVKAKKGKQIKIGLHFNHPKELTKEAITAIRLLQANNVQIYNQTVLLKGINDETEVLADLFQNLLSEGVELHYLSIAMKVPRTKHLRTSIQKGQEIMFNLSQINEFRGKLPSLEFSAQKGKIIIPTPLPKQLFTKIEKLL